MRSAAGRDSLSQVLAGISKIMLAVSRIGATFPNGKLRIIACLPWRLIVTGDAGMRGGLSLR